MFHKEIVYFFNVLPFLSAKLNESDCKTFKLSIMMFIQVTKDINHSLNTKIFQEFIFERNKRQKIVTNNRLKLSLF